MKYLEGEEITNEELKAAIRGKATINAESPSQYCVVLPSSVGSIDVDAVLTTFKPNFDDKGINPDTDEEEERLSI